MLTRDIFRINVLNVSPAAVEMDVAVCLLKLSSAADKAVALVSDCKRAAIRKIDARITASRVYGIICNTDCYSIKSSR